MDKKIKVAQIIGKGENGGVESCILNYYRAIDRSAVEFHFFLENTSDLINDDVISKLGGKIILTPKYTHLIKYIKFLKKTFCQNQYDIVHSNLNSLSVFPLFAAKLAKVKIRIAHSHSTSNKKEFLRNAIKAFLKLFSKCFANEFFACSNNAGQWLFGKKILLNSHFHLILNGIDYKRFAFNEDKRKEIRNTLGINDNVTVYGHIGRLASQKNQIFLLEVFKKIIERDQNSILIIIGSGELESTLHSVVSMNGLDNNVIFIKPTPNIDAYYNCFDVFILPSLYEGLGLVLIEAQVNGLLCFTSTNVPDEARISQNLHYLDLRKGSAFWSESILKFLPERSFDYNDTYQIDVLASNLLEIYMRFINYYG